AFSHHAKLLASASEDHSVMIWDTATDGLRHSFWDPSDSVCSVSFSHDSKLVATAPSASGTRRMDNGQLLQALWGHSAKFRVVIFSHDSTLLTPASVDKTVRVWES
ncbi:WD40-repeat-containing domain protein, partial [Schizothecium vesticola]